MHDATNIATQAGLTGEFITNSFTIAIKEAVSCVDTPAVWQAINTVAATLRFGKNDGRHLVEVALPILDI
jgi:hypothetical protein